MRHAPQATPRRAREFEQVYRANVAAVTSYFARRTTDPQQAADLTADTFEAAIVSFATFDPARGTPRSWVFGIARHVHARHRAATARDDDAVARLGGRRELTPDETAELVGRIDAERSARRLLDALATLPRTDRDVIELVDLSGLSAREAAAALGISAAAVRVRSFRARRRLRTLTETALEATT